MVIIYEQAGVAYAGHEDKVRLPRNICDHSWGYHDNGKDLHLALAALMS